MFTTDEEVIEISLSSHDHGYSQFYFKVLANMTKDNVSLQIVKKFCKP
jgi:hypothetical protein